MADRSRSGSRPGARASGPKPPRHEAIALADLAEGLPGDLGPGENLDGLSFTDIDLAGGSLAGATIAECAFRGLDLDDTDLRGVRIVDSVLERLNAPVWRIPRSTMRDVRIEGSRIGSAEAYDAGWRSVEFVACKIGYLNLRGASLADISFTDCTIEELDLGGARVERLALSGTDLDTLDLTGATLADADLRGPEPRTLRGIDNLSGATMSEHQFLRLTPLLAERLGITLTA